ncbi:DUF2062 domain-containing protein [Jannaschia sp. CCS1]|uniref:DUF2062 domain-containing protein n=1 Tax=Jannaschia sp. (strain CCS1) TaxID=290400 RepID=UPI0000539FC7|nr:DUF2062 domain-containing protein [Jannaschia sp. CCS1]ABD53432.1 hypothetical protein Jann_0515 [Jannaschia sp. CCS1]
MFRRRDYRPWYRIILEVLWPRGGWLRAAQYVQHRMRRLPGTPEQIARGVFAGAVTVFTPYFGLHFVIAALLARAMRGSIFAALLATFIGNPLTYVPIAALSLNLGHFMLGSRPTVGVNDSLFRRFGGASRDLWHNIKALFTPEQAHWGELQIFWDTVMWPWTVGGILPGLLCGTICYFLTVPVVRAYQKSRAARLRKKMDKLRKQAEAAE